MLARHRLQVSACSRGCLCFRVGGLALPRSLPIPLRLLRHSRECTRPTCHGTSPLACPPLEPCNTILAGSSMAPPHFGVGVVRGRWPIGAFPWEHPGRSGARNSEPRTAAAVRQHDRGAIWRCTALPLSGWWAGSYTQAKAKCCVIWFCRTVRYHEKLGFPAEFHHVVCSVVQHHAELHIDLGNNWTPCVLRGNPCFGQPRSEPARRGWQRPQMLMADPADKTDGTDQHVTRRMNCEWERQTPSWQPQARLVTSSHGEGRSGPNYGPNGFLMLVLKGRKEL